MIYKMTHLSDPTAQEGVFGVCDCMGAIRRRKFDAVIGIGGIGHRPKRFGIAGKLTWVGIVAKKFDDGDRSKRGPQVAFRHFRFFGPEGPLLRAKYPALADRIYARNVRSFMHAATGSTKASSQ